MVFALMETFLILALDTATRVAGLALYDGRRLWNEEIWWTKQQHTVEMLPRVDQALRGMGLTPADLKGVAVAIGPGSFTGLRSGLSLAKGLAMAGALPIVGIPTLDVVAYPHRLQPLPVCAVVEAGRGRICWCFYTWREGQWLSASPYRLGEVGALCDEISQPTLIAGELEPAAADILRARLGSLAVVASPVLGLRRPGCLAEIGWERLARGEQDDPVTLSPIYLHEPAVGAVGL
jgi:tRNA threonylcarbamoyladenosine biosynthesis protein TsaB